MKPGDFVVPREERLPWKHGSHGPWKHGLVVAVTRREERHGSKVVRKAKVLVLTDATRLIDESLDWMVSCCNTLDSHL